MLMLWHNKEIMFSLQRPLKKRNKFPIERWKHMDLMDYNKEKKIPRENSRFKHKTGK